eukprot:TRINITY_DN1935_c0_g1_i2.p1 TRINITY_DN1935_c0_g1~~TRINITY_DN1935_c0_g1_i2.p1  ORF type:complete len:114 (-),score=12.21 TRINITY_DN1935_c0_g1_i2:42-383(-)
MTAVVVPPTSPDPGDIGISDAHFAAAVGGGFMGLLCCSLIIGIVLSLTCRRDRRKDRVTAAADGDPEVGLSDGVESGGHGGGEGVPEDRPPPGRTVMVQARAKSGSDFAIRPD